MLRTLGPLQENAPIETKELALSLADLIDERQGEDIVVLDVSGPLAIADYFVIATARNSRHANAMARELSMLAKSGGAAFRRLSGVDTESGWVLLDFDTVVVHLFDAEKRAFYARESRWSAVPRVPVGAQPRAATPQS
ncbi:MAG: ribosome silencing factor, partial [Planctomycetota bacterium]